MKKEHTDRTDIKTEAGEVQRETLTLQKLLDEGKKVLQKAGVAEWDLDARYLLMEAFELDMVHFLLKRNDRLDADCTEIIKKTDQYQSWIEKRARRIPLQYLTGKQEFMGLEFLVNENVLIPRQDTETLVELVLKLCPAEQYGRVLDMCTGSGCIGISLSALGGYREVTAADISPLALEVAAENAKRILRQEKNGAGQEREDRKFTLAESDLFQKLDKSQKYDIIVSNPPYIATEVIAGLEPEVRDYEPRLALDGTEDGLYFYRRLSLEGREFLEPGGHMFLEIGCDQGEAVKGLMEENGFSRVSVTKDGAGLDRVVHGIYKNGL